MNFKDFLILENTTKQATNYIEKEFGLNYDRELTIPEWIDSHNELALWSIIDFCKLPVRIPNISKKGNNNLDIVYLLTHLLMEESKLLYSLVYLDGYLNYEVKDTETKYTWSQFVEILEKSERDTEVIDQKYLDYNFEREGRWDLDNIVSHLLKYNSYLNLLPLGNPSSMSIRQFEQHFKNRTEYTISEYLYDYLVVWMPKRIESNRWIKNFPSNIRAGFRNDIKSMEQLMTLIGEFDNLKRIEKEEIWNTYFIQHEEDRGIIKRYNTASEFITDFSDRITSIKGGKKEVIDKIKLLGSQVEIVYDQNNIMVVLIGSYGASNDLGCDTSWCISTSSVEWERYNGPETLNVQYFVYDFNKESEDIHSRIGITVQQDSTIGAAHLKDDQELLMDSAWNYLTSIGLKYPKRILKPISVEIIKKREKAKSQKEKAESIILAAADQLKNRGRLTGTTQHKKFEKLLQSNILTELNLEGTKIVGVLLALKKFDILEKLLDEKRVLISDGQIIYLIKKGYYDIAKIYLQRKKKLESDFEKRSKLFDVITKIESDEVYNRFYKIYDDLYYEYDGERMGKKDHQPVRGMVDHYIMTRNKERIEDLIKKIPSININNYQSDELSSTSFLNYFIYMRTKRHERKLNDQDIDFIKWLQSKGGYITDESSVKLLFKSHRDIYFENFSKLNREQNDSFSTSLFLDIIKEDDINFKDLDLLLKGGADFREVKEYNLRRLLSDTSKTEVLKYLIDMGLDLNKYKVSNRHGHGDTHDITKVIDHFKDDIEYLKKILPKIKFITKEKRDNGSEYLLYTHYANAFFSKLMRTFAGTGKLKEVMDAVDHKVGENDISYLFAKYLERNKDVTDRQLEEVIKLHKPGYINVISTEVLNKLHKERPKVYTLAKSYVEPEDSWETFEEILKTKNVTLIHPIITPESIEKYRKKLRKNDLIFSYITTLDTLEKLVDNGYEFSEKNFREIIRSGIDDIKDEELVPIIDLLISQGMKFKALKSSQKYDNKDYYYITHILKKGNLELIKRLMDPFKDQDLQSWKTVHTKSRRIGRNYDSRYISMVNNDFDDILKHRVDIIKYFVEDIKYLGKLDKVEGHVNWQGNPTNFEIDLSRIAPDNEFNYKYKNDKEKLRYLYYDIYKKSGNYPNIDFKLELPIWAIIVSGDLSLVQYIVEELGGDPTNILHKLCIGDYWSGDSKKRGTLKELEYLYEKEADVVWVYEEEKQSNKLSYMTRDFLRSKREEIYSRNESKIFNYQQFRNWNI